MKGNSWLKLAVINLLLVIAILLPFIPGPANQFVIGLSAFSQFAGFLGLVLIPVGIFWTILEIKKTDTRTGKELSQPKSIFYLAIASVVIITTICVVLAIAAIAVTGMLTGVIIFIFISAGLYVAVRELRKLKHANGRFTSWPLYLITIPLISLLSRMFLVGPASDYSRNYAIERSKVLIESIEEFKMKEGVYPESINELEKIKGDKAISPGIMGIPRFRYNKINEYYSISFSQWLEFGSLEEIVLYDKNGLRHNLSGKYAEYDYSFDLCRVQGAFAVHDTRHVDWQYYLLD